jgi:hypothetical protein
MNLNSIRVLLQVDLLLCFPVQKHKRRHKLCSTSFGTWHFSRPPLPNREKGIEAWLTPFPVHGGGGEGRNQRYICVTARFDVKLLVLEDSHAMTTRCSRKNVLQRTQNLGTWTVQSNSIQPFLFACSPPNRCNFSSTLYPPSCWCIA